MLSCETFPPALTVTHLVQTYGAAAVKSGEVYLGEGQSVRGTLLFPDSPRDRVEIVWQDAKARRRPELVRISGSSSRWQMPDGLTLGTDLKWLERRNGEPFRLFGFSWDFEGAVTSWGSGALAAPESAPCRVLVRLRPKTTDNTRAVSGDREFPSSHPTLQAINPRVREIALSYLTPGR